ncbi:MAG: MFS transporter [Deltaproteobacteria bacterium]|nr:MFS transporter [Deltaproteobacteria bacterium]
MSTSPKALSLFQMIAYSLGNFAQGVGPAIVIGWLQYFYTKSETTLDGNILREGNAFLSYATFGFIAGGARLMEAISNPIYGYISDKSRTKWGRRKPFVMFLAPLLVSSFIAMWFPLYPTTHIINAFWLAIMLGIFWLSYAGVVGPYLSLLPEITPYREERIKLSEIMGYFEVGGMLVATIVAGMIIERFSGGLNLGLLRIADGYKLLAIIVGIITLICFWLSIRYINETPHNRAKEVPFNFLEAISNTFRNRLFAPYVASVAFFRIGIDSVIISMPYLIVKVLGKKEDLAGAMQGAVIVFSLLLFPIVSKLSTRYGKKLIYNIGLLGFAIGLPLFYFTQSMPFLGSIIINTLSLFGLEFRDPVLSKQIAHITLILLIISFPISTAFVLPRAIFADVVDNDEKETGYRREAMYNGMEGIISKSAAALVPVITTQLFSFFGATTERPVGILLVGPVAGLLVFFGFLSFSKYPLKE